MILLVLVLESSVIGGIKLEYEYEYEYRDAEYECDPTAETASKRRGKISLTRAG